MYADIDDDCSSPTWSAPTISRLPAATTRMSARLVTSGRSRVREWQIVTVAFSQEQLCERLAHEVRASDDDGLASGELYAVALEELDHTVRGARQETRQADGEPSDALGAEAVHVLGRGYARDQRHRVESFGQRELDEEA